MGHDVSTIGNHKLNISNIEALAKDLSKRFRANVDYGYYHQFWIDIDGNEFEPSYENVIFGKISYPNSTQTIWLSDEYYQIHQIISKHGDDYLKLPCVIESDSLKLEFESAIKGVSFELRDNENDIDYGTIYNDTFQNFWHSFDSRWWSFCRAFMEDSDIWSVGFDAVNHYRRQIMDLFTTIGGDKVVHLDDQGETQYLTYGDYNWQEILNELNADFKETTLDISEFMKHKNLLPKDMYPLAFYDDFNDLISQKS